ncbi:unnamed protein product [Urochloa humidicola]
MLKGNIDEIIMNLRIDIPRFARALRQSPAAASTWRMLALVHWVINLTFQGMCYVTVCLYWYSGPVVCIALALWRIAQHDYSGDASGSPAGNLVPALDMFYSLVLLQGAVYAFWTSWEWGIFGDDPAGSLRQYRQEIGLPDEGWCRDYLARYLADTRARCWREPRSIRGRTLHHFALESLDSGSWEEMHSGVRWLDALARQGVDLRPLLLPCRPRIQKLIDALGWWQQNGTRDREMRVATARIVARLAPQIHLAQFPGAMECISSLLQTRGPNNELILQGLLILERLASDQHNCTAICSTPGLLRKIMVPLSSTHLINDISNNTEWIRVVRASFSVLHTLLVNTTGKASSQLRRKIYSNKQSMSHLETILEHGQQSAGWELEELKMLTMRILTQLAGDLSINLAMETKKKLSTKLLQIFLKDRELFRACAGQTLQFLLTKTGSNAALVMNTQNDIIGRLAGILDAKNHFTYRKIAANILENLCTHCDLDKQWVKETLLPKVLEEILSCKRKTPENNVSPPSNQENQQIDSPPGDEENQQNSAPINDEETNNISTQQGDEENQQNSAPINDEETNNVSTQQGDEENQQNSAPINVEETNNISTQQGDIEIQETSPTVDQKRSSDGGNKQQFTTSKFTREAFLSLALVIRDKLVSADDFDNAVQKEGVGPAAFVGKIKTIVEDNCQANAESLRIVKLCCRIAEPMLQRDQYAQHFRNTGFVELVSNASKNMSNLESCMLFSEDDFGRLKKNVRPTLSDLKNQALRLVG